MVLIKNSRYDIFNILRDLFILYIYNAKRKGLMYNKNLPGRRGLIDEFHIGLELFLDFVSSKYEFMDGNKLRCR